MAIYFKFNLTSHHIVHFILKSFLKALFLQCVYVNFTANINCIYDAILCNRLWVICICVESTEQLNILLVADIVTTLTAII